MKLMTLILEILYWKIHTWDVTMKITQQMRMHMRTYRQNVSFSDTFHQLEQNINEFSSTGRLHDYEDLSARNKYQG